MCEPVKLPHLPGLILLACLCQGVAPAGSMRVRPDLVETSEVVSRHERDYEELVRFRDSHPVVFDEHHPFYFKLLTEPRFMNRIVARWEAHEARLDFYSPYLGRVLDGYVHLHEPLAPPPIPPPVIGEPPGSPGTGNGQNGEKARGSGGGSGGGGLPPGAVPEPSGLFLLLAGASWVGVGVIRGRTGRSRRP